jgi:hypothetical protein
VAIKRPTDQNTGCLEKNAVSSVLFPDRKYQHVIIPQSFLKALLGHRQFWSQKPGSKQKKRSQKELALDTTDLLCFIVEIIELLAYFFFRQNRKNIPKPNENRFSYLAHWNRLNCFQLRVCENSLFELSPF